MFYIWIFFLVFIDLFTKFFAKNNLLIWKELVGDFLYLKYVENIWIAFSIPITWITLKILTIIIILVIFWYYFKEDKKKKEIVIDISYIFILAWAIWNWYERIFNWKVIDFIWIKYFSIFNLADVFIFLWVTIYIIYTLFFNKNQNVKWWHLLTKRNKNH